MSDSRPDARPSFLQLVESEGWQYTTRIRGTGVVGIVTLTTGNEVILVEQYRVPVGRPVLELPAGLVGDEPDESRETRLEAAQRELREETGFTSTKWTELGTVTSSAGLTDEQVTIFVAREATRCAPGGGVGDERIKIHAVPRHLLPELLAARLAAGEPVDGKVFAIEAMLALTESRP